MAKRGIFDDPVVDEVVDEVLPRYNLWLADNREPPRNAGVAPSVDNYDTMRDYEIDLKRYNDVKAHWDDWNDRRKQAERLTERGWSNTAQGNP